MPAVALDVDCGSSASDRLDRAERAAARRQAGDRLSAWLADVEHVIGQADRRQIAALAEELSGRRVRGARR